MAKANKVQIFDAVVREREFQDKKWGSVDITPHDLAMWVLILEEEVQEAREACVKNQKVEVLREMIQVAAVAFACLEQHGIMDRDEIANAILETTNGIG